MTKTIDFAGIALLIFALLMIFGVIALTPVSVGIGLILAKTTLSLTWT